MVELTEGGRYRLPNGEKVTARLVEGRFILEYKRPYRAPLSVDREGNLFLRGEQTGMSIDSMMPDTEDQ